MLKSCQNAAFRQNHARMPKEFPASLSSAEVAAICVKHNSATTHTRNTKLKVQAGGLQKLSLGESRCDGAGCTKQAAIRSSGSAAPEHLTNLAKGKRPREMPTESNKVLRQWI